MKKIYKLAEEWVLCKTEIPSIYYCPISATFRARISRLSDELSNSSIEYFRDKFSLIVAVVGEIGENSFDHNFGSWRDVSGVFFSYDIKERCVILADRGQGILNTLKRVRPSLASDEEALMVAFNEIVSGRAPEVRGNGLKFVKRIALKNKMNISFESGHAKLVIKGDGNLHISRKSRNIQGCIAVINF